MANLKPQNPLRRRNSGAPTWIHGPKLAEDLASLAAIKENARYTGENQMLDMVSQASCNSLAISPLSNTHHPSPLQALLRTGSLAAKTSGDRSAPCARPTPDALLVEVGVL